MAVRFDWVYNLSGGTPTIQTWTVKDTVVLSKGELGTADTAEVDAAASNDSTLLGACVEASDNTSDGETVRIIVNPDAVYEVTDLNARNAGDTLDIAAGGLSVEASSDVDLIIVENSSATELTRVRIVPEEHAWG